MNWRGVANAFLVWLETTSFSTWMRESPSVLAFPAILSLHTIGMGLVVGLIAMIDLRVLGVASRVPLLETRRFLRIIWFGFWLNAVSGVALLIGYPTKALTNPVFYAKLGFIALGLAGFKWMRNIVFRDPAFDMSPVSRKGRILAVASLACWTGAIATGRLLAYTYVRLTSVWD
jgi:hypothetical protein